MRFRPILATGESVRSRQTTPLGYITMLSFNTVPSIHNTYSTRHRPSGDVRGSGAMELVGRWVAGSLGPRSGERQRCMGFEIGSSNCVDPECCVGRWRTRNGPGPTRKSFPPSFPAVFQSGCTSMPVACRRDLEAGPGYCRNSVSFCSTPGTPLSCSMKRTTSSQCEGPPRREGCHRRQGMTWRRCRETCAQAPQTPPPCRNRH